MTYDLEAATLHLAEADTTMAQLIAHVGPCRLEQRDFDDPFAALLRAIVFQQISTAAASTIHGRVQALFPNGTPSPTALLALDEETLRGAGLSRPKQRAARSLAERVLDGTVPPTGDLAALSDEDLVARLTQVRGIGPWTVQMLLIFNLGRPYVLPTTDLGVQRGAMNAYGLDALPSPTTLAAMGTRWQPYRSVASWYLWRAA
ncbi:MAG: DNA-3-methyladenine glycosylase [Bacteroidota bacterium]